MRGISGRRWIAAVAWLLLFLVLRDRNGESYGMYYLYLVSAAAQVLAAIVGLTAIATVYRLGSLDQGLNTQLVMMAGRGLGVIPQLNSHFDAQRAARQQIFDGFLYPALLASGTIVLLLCLIPFLGENYSCALVSLALALTTLCITETWLHLRLTFKPIEIRRL